MHFGPPGDPPDLVLKMPNFNEFVEFDSQSSEFFCHWSKKKLVGIGSLG